MNEQSNSETSDARVNTAGDTIKAAARRGADDAKKISSELIPAVKNTVHKLGYGVAFGTAYGGSFAVTLIKQLTPRALKTGCSEGIASGRKAAENLLKPAEATNEITSPEGAGYAVT